MKKNQYILVCLLFVTFCASAQLEDNYILDFDSELRLNHVLLDTVSDPGNIWRIGEPQKFLFTEAFNGPNVIVTDRVNSYPVNDTSVFTIINVASGRGFEVPHTVIMGGYYYVDSDTLSDYGLIEFSPDKGETWIDLVNDSVLMDSTYHNYWYWFEGSEKPVLTGFSNGWESFYINLAALGYYYNVHDGDTVLYRFSFISDSIQTNRDGLMFDNLYFWDYTEGITEAGFQGSGSVCYPNPVNDMLTIEFNNDENATLDLELFDLSGKEVLTRQNISGNRVELDINGMASGIYFYRLRSRDRKENSSGKFVKE